MRVRLATALLALLSTTLAAQERTPLSIPYTEITLDNGLHVILHQDRSVPIVAVNLWYHVGSANEKPGRTGFAHLFEHLMFEGSKHVPEGAFDNWLEAAGGTNNGSTDLDRTNYIIDVPESALELALMVESDRMGFLLDTMTPKTVDGQRDVVKNERRQSYENAPYGKAYLALPALLYPKGHPYSWSTIGSMDDLTAASYDDVVHFFKTYYTPNNASLVIAGDIDVADTRRLVERWFGSFPRGGDVPPLVVPPVQLDGVKRETITDRVQLPKLHLAWHSPAQYAPADAALDLIASVLSSGRSSRLYRRLVYDLQVAQEVSAYQQSQALGSVFNVEVMVRPGHPVDDVLRIVDEELDRLRNEPVPDRELAGALNQVQATFYRGMERVGGFYGKANQLNQYYTETGLPDFFEGDLARYRALSPADLQSAAKRFLPAGRRVELIVVPEGQE
ncbi:MAG: M16 family metallopeptidase [Vicinamibacterales bacterium]